MVGEHGFHARKGSVMGKLLAIAALATVGTPYANTMSGGKLFICATPQPNDLEQAEYEALVWTQIRGVGSHGETGNSQNIVGYDTWDILFQQKAKGIANAGDPEVELARITGDAGQNLFRLAAGARNSAIYAFKIERNDAPTGGTPTTFYNRGVVTGPRTQHGRNEDFDLEIYTIGCTQEQITVESSVLSVTGTVPPGTDGNAYTFTPTVANGTSPYTFEWYGDDLAQFDLAFNPTTGAITSAELDGTGTIIGTITVTDAEGNRGFIRVEIVIS